MSNELALFDQTSFQLPDYMKDFAATHSNTLAREGVPTLSYRGRKWSTIIKGERTTLMRRTADGEEEAVGLLKVILLDCAPKRGRSYYVGKFDPENTSAPACWSSDSVTPDSSIENPQAKTCGDCPMAVKGSRINEMGRATVACQQHHILAVVPAANLAHVPMRLKLSITSIYDVNSPDLEKSGWFAFDQYRRFLAAKGIGHTGMVITKVKMDPNVDYPKAIFSPERPCTPAEFATVQSLIDTKEVKDLIKESWATAEGTVVQPAKAGGPVQQAVTERPKVIEGEVVAPSAPPAEKPKTTRKAATKPVVEEDADPFGASASEPAKPASSASTELPEDVADLMSAWGA